MLNNYFAINCVFILKKTEEKTNYTHYNVYLKNYEGFSNFSHDIFSMNKEKFTCDFQIYVPVLYQLS